MPRLETRQNQIEQQLKTALNEASDGNKAVKFRLAKVLDEALSKGVASTNPEWSEPQDRVNFEIHGDYEALKKALEKQKLAENHEFSKEHYHLSTSKGLQTVVKELRKRNEPTLF